MCPHRFKVLLKRANLDVKLVSVEEDDDMDGDFQVDLSNHAHHLQGGVLPFMPDTSQNGHSHSATVCRCGRVGASTNDQRFLLLFILGGYFGPDLRNDMSRRSALEREALGLPLYTADQLGGSVFKLSEIESIYYYVLRNSHPSARVKLQSLYKFLQGHLAPPVKEPLDDERQFPSCFPPNLHRHSRYKGTYKVVESMVFIDNPDVSFMKPEDVERFKRLSGLSELALSREEARSFQHGQRSDRDEERQARFYATAEAQNHIHESRPLSIILGDIQNDPSRKKRKKKDSNLLQVESFVPFATPPVLAPKEEITQWTPNNKMGATIMLLPSLPTLDQWSHVVNASKPSIIFTGTAAARQAGPLIGLVDIGVCDDAYLFRTALPGVKKDEGDFNCEVECDGKVLITGVTTTGENRIFRGSQEFLMQTQCLCPPGTFTISFHLPGPVEPGEFTGTFGSDGILEGVVLKQRETYGAASLTFEP